MNRVQKPLATSHDALIRTNKIRKPTIAERDLSSKSQAVERVTDLTASNSQQKLVFKEGLYDACFKIEQPNARSRQQKNGKFGVIGKSANLKPNAEEQKLNIIY